jgi:hypothetical protein
MIGIGETVHLGKHVAFVEVGSAVKDEDRRTFSDLAGVERSSSDRDAAFADRGTLLATKRYRDKDDGNGAGDLSDRKRPEIHRGNAIAKSFWGQ